MVQVPSPSTTSILPFAGLGRGEHDGREVERADHAGAVVARGVVVQRVDVTATPCGVLVASSDAAGGLPTVTCTVAVSVVPLVSATSYSTAVAVPVARV